jgi:hypothetical protein
VTAAARQTIHPSERANRTAKVRTLVDALAVHHRGFDGLIAKSLANWTPDDWQLFAERLRLKKPPSPATIEIVIGIFDDRERRAAELQNAPEFWSATIGRVSAHSGSWTITTECGLGLVVPSDLCVIAPRVGERVQIFGRRGAGSRVRGIEIAGRVYRADHDAQEPRSAE